MDFDDGLIKFLESTDDVCGANLYDINSKGERIVRTSPGIVESVKQLLDLLEKVN